MPLISLVPNIGKKGGGPPFIMGFSETLLPWSGNGKRIEGEIYEVDDDKLKILDKLEGVPSHYIRRQVQVESSLADGSEILPCWLYIKEKFKPELLKLPHLDTYSPDTYRDKPYIPR